MGGSGRHLHPPDHPRGLLAGVDLEAGALLGAVLSSANRDPRRFTDPDRFDVHRRKGRTSPSRPAPTSAWGHGSAATSRGSPWRSCSSDSPAWGWPRSGP